MVAKRIVQKVIRPRTGLLLSVALAAALGYLVMRPGQPPTAEASHRFGNAHNGTQHFGAWYEEYCVWNIDNPANQASTYNHISNTLYVTNPSQDWDSLAYEPGAGYRIFFYGATGATPCWPNSYGAYFEVQYRIQNDWTSECGGAHTLRV